MVFSFMSALMARWLSPTPLFIFINLTIATIFFISRLSPRKMPYAVDDDRNSSPPPRLQPAPSFISRLTSFNFSTCRFPLSNDGGSAAHGLERAPSILERVKSINCFYNYKYSPQSTETDNIQPVQLQQPLSRAPSLLERVKSFYKSDSIKSNQTEPTVTDSTGSDTGIGPVHSEEDDHGVDAKADAFINKFKQQLKLQRLDSLLRYRDKLKRK